MSRRGLDLGPSFTTELVKKYESVVEPDRTILDAHQLVSRTEIAPARKAEPNPTEKLKTETKKMDYSPSFGSLVSRNLLSSPQPIPNKQVDQVAWQASTDNDVPDPADLESRLRKQRLSSPWQSVPMDANAISAALTGGK
jgi:hypothetical protein